MLNRLIVAAVLLFAFAECQYSIGGGSYSSFNNYNGGGGGFSSFPGSYGSGIGGFGGGFLGASSYGSGLGSGFPSFGSGIGGYNNGGGLGIGGLTGQSVYRPNYAQSGGNAPTGGQDLNVYQPIGGVSTIAYNSNQFKTPYFSIASALPYSGSPVGHYDLYKRNYASMYGNFYPQGPPPPPAYTGGVPYGEYEPDVYGSGRLPFGFKANPNAGTVRPINGFPGALAPNPFYMADDEFVPYSVFDTLYKQNYGRRYDPDNIQVPSAPTPLVAPTQPIYHAPGTNYFGYNYGANYGSAPVPTPLPAPAGFYNGYGQFIPASPAPSPPTDAPATTTPKA